MSQTTLFEEPQEEAPDGLDPTRTARQEEAVDKWQAFNGKGTFMAVTGFGKSRTAMMGAERLCNSPNAKRQRDVTVVVPSLPIYNDWMERKKKVSFPMEVFTIQSYVRKYSLRNKRKTSLLIADEMHRYFSEVFGTLFYITDYSFVFGTTATIDPTDPKFESLSKIAPIVDHVPLKEARKNNWVSPYTVYNLGIDMNDEGLSKYRGIQRQYNKYFKTFDFDYGLAMSCISDKETRRDYARQIGWEEGAVMTHAVQFSRTVGKRKQFLYDYPTKLTLSQEIITRFSDDNFITFSQTTNFPDQLEELLGDIAVAYHSNLPTLIVDKHTKEIVARGVEVNGKTRYRDSTGTNHTWAQIKKAYPKRKLKRKGKKTRRKEAIRRFKEDPDCRAILSGQALDEGVDIPAITAGIVSSGSSTTRQSIQRLGRGIRKVEGKEAFFVELYVKNSQEEVWLRSRQEETGNVKWIQSIDEILIQD